MTPEQYTAVEAFVDIVRRHYGTRLVDVRVYGSRARGEAHDESDLDLAIILDDGNWEFWDEKRWLAKQASPARFKADIYIQPWPVRRSAWDDPSTHANPRLIEKMRRDARDLKDAA